MKRIEFKNGGSINFVPYDAGEPLGDSVYKELNPDYIFTTPEIHRAVDVSNLLFANSSGAN